MMEIEQQASTFTSQLSVESYRQLAQLLYDFTSISIKNRIEASQIYRNMDGRLRDPAFLQTLAAILKNGQSRSYAHFDKHLSAKGAAIALKYYSRNYRLKYAERESLVNILFPLVLQSQLDFRIKESLGDAILFQINSDEDSSGGTGESLIRRTIQDKLLCALAQEDVTPSRIQSCTVIMATIFNSLLDSSLQMTLFLRQVLQPYINLGHKLYKVIKQTPLDSLESYDDTTFNSVQNYFDFFEGFSKDLACDDHMASLDLIIESPLFISLLENYLRLFGHVSSMICKNSQGANSYKSAIIRTLILLYQKRACPRSIIELMLSTVLYESREIVNDLDVEVITMNAIHLLDLQLNKREHIELFERNKTQLIYALLTYSATNREEEEMMTQNHAQFIEISQSYAEYNEEVRYVKVQAGNFLRTIACVLPDGLNLIFLLVMMILRSFLRPKAIMQDEKEEATITSEQTAFQRLGVKQQIEICLLALSGLHKQIGQNEDMKDIVYKFLSGEGEHLKASHHPIVMLRLIRTVSYFPSEDYFKYIENKMNRGELFMLEGINAFLRISSNPSFPIIGKILSNIFIKIIDGFRVSESVMVNLIRQYYFPILCKDPVLHKKCIAKLAISFYQSFGSYSHYEVNNCFQLLQYFLEREDDEERFKFVEMAVMQLANNLIEGQDAKYLKAHQEDLIGFYHTIAARRVDFKYEIQQFLLKTIKWLEESKEAKPKLFKFYAKFLNKFNKEVKLSRYFTDFTDELKRRVLTVEHTPQSLSIVAFLSCIISQIIALGSSLVLTGNDQKAFLKLAHKLPESHRQYPLLVLFAYVYRKPYEVTHYLKKLSLYSTFLQLVSSTAFEGATCRKLLNLAFVKLLQVEEDLKYLRCILQQCIANFTPLDLRGFQQNQPCSYIYPSKLGDLFGELQHPLMKLNELKQLRNICLWWKEEQLLDNLDVQSQAELESLMEERTCGAYKRSMKRAGRAHL